MRPSAAWIERRRRGAIGALRRAASATDLVRVRGPFGWTVRPAPGSILASARIAAWDPEPDYFHHWVRDAAIALRAWPEIMAAVEPSGRLWWAEAFADHVRFSLALGDPDRPAPEGNPLRATTREDHRRFLRPDAELRALVGPARLEEPRFAADGGPDLERWGRPQDDGPALRASACLRVIERRPELRSPDAERLIERDLAHVARAAGRPCIGPWEDGPARRTGFTLIAQWDALDRGARWRAARGGDAGTLARAAAALLPLIEETADPAEPAWRESVEAPPGRLDAGTVLAILHADRREGPLALDAPRTLGTVAGLARRFAEAYPINRGRAVPAMGRWPEDGFAGGNPWFPVTLACAELHYRIGTPEAVAKAEAWMALVEAVAPEGDDLPEQFDRATGEPRSCLGLTWSAAAFLGAAAARDAAI